MIVPGKRYTAQEAAALRSRYPDFRVPGFTTRANFDGTIQFVPWQQASAGGGSFRGKPSELADADKPLMGFKAEADFGDLTPIKRREARVQLVSLMDRVRPDFMAGRVMSAAQVAAYVSDPKRKKELESGTAQLTEDDFRQVMHAFIKRAEDENEILQAKQVVRTSPTD